MAAPLLYLLSQLILQISLVSVKNLQDVMPESMDLIYVNWGGLTFWRRYFVVGTLEVCWCQKVSLGLNQLCAISQLFLLILQL